MPFFLPPGQARRAQALYLSDFFFTRRHAFVFFRRRFFFPFGPMQTFANSDIQIFRYSDI